MREEYFGSTYLYCAHPWKLKEEEEEEEEERAQILDNIIKNNITQNRQIKKSNALGAGVSFASKWKTRNRKVEVWVINTYSDINKINEKVCEQRYFSCSKWIILKNRKGIIVGGYDVSFVSEWNMMCLSSLNELGCVFLFRVWKKRKRKGKLGF